MPTVEVVTRRGCHLCEQAHAELLALRERVPFELKEIDVDARPELTWLYGWAVPVVLIEGQVISRLRLDEAALQQRLREVAARPTQEVAS